MTGLRGDDLWEAVGRLLDTAPLISDLQEHRLELLGARRLRELGRPVPAPLLEAERDAAVVLMTAPMVLERVRGALEGSIVLFKGLEVAALYPEPGLRTMRDLDLLVPDAPGAQRRLIDVGFVEVGPPEIYENIHHLRPLAWPGLPVIVELHHSPKWVEWGTPPSLDELLANARAAATGVPGVLSLSASHHALVVAAHSWSNTPLGRMRDLLDAHLLAAEAAPGELMATARRWGLDHMWRTTSAVTAAVLDPTMRRPLVLASWGRNLRPLRGRTVVEHHLERWTSPFSALPPRPASAAVAGAIARDLRPEPGESWGAKGRRACRALRDARRRKTHHDLDAETPPDGIA